MKNRAGVYGGNKRTSTMQAIELNVQDFPEPLALELKKPLKMPITTSHTAIETVSVVEYDAVTMDEFKKAWDET